MTAGPREGPATSAGEPLGEARHAPVGGPSIGIVLDWYARRLTADRFANRTRLVVPPELAGWVVPGPGEPADGDGLRPLGAVRDRLERAVAHADLTDQQRTVLRARAGLTEYPAPGRHRPLARRVPVRRHPRRGTGAVRAGLGERRLRELHAAAVRRLDALGLTDPRGDAGVAAGPVPDPARAPWFVERVPAAHRFHLLEHAIEAARAFVAVGGEGAPVDGPMRDLDDYLRALRTSDWPPRRGLGRSRAHALVGLALWGLVAEPARDLGIAAAAGSGCRTPPDRPAAASEALGRLLGGSVDDATVVAACTDTLECDRRDHTAARAMADVLLYHYEQHHGRLGGDAAATILRTVVRVRAVDHDPTVLGLVRLAHAAHPRAWQTVDAAQCSVPVAAACGLDGRANELCRSADAALDTGITLPPGRVRHVENAEFRLWSMYRRTGVARHRLDVGAGSDLDLRSALKLADRALAAFHQVRHLNDHVARGDAVPEWEFFFHIRASELRLVAAAATDGAPARTSLRRAGAHARDAKRLLGETGLGQDGLSLVALLKVELRAALLLEDEDRACALVREISDRGWPVARTPAMLPGAGRGRPGRLRRLVSELVDVQSDGAATIVDGSNRRRWSLA